MKKAKFASYMYMASTKVVGEGMFNATNCNESQKVKKEGTKQRVII